MAPGCASGQPLRSLNSPGFIFGSVPQVREVSAEANHCRARDQRRHVSIITLSDVVCTRDCRIISRAASGPHIPGELSAFVTTANATAKRRERILSMCNELKTVQGVFICDVMLRILG